jgi:hypothetical protein
MAKRATRKRPPTGRPRGGPPHTLWKKGAPSPNPGGRPAVFAEVREAAQKEGLACIQTLVAIRDDLKNPALVRIAASNSLLDRGYGRPVQGVAVQNLQPLPPPGHVTKQMSAQEAAEIYAATLRHGRFDDSGALAGPSEPSTIEGKCVDVTPESSGEDPA